MSDRNRELPPWMSKREKEKEKERARGPLKSRRKPKVARSVFYCMNEKELVQAAVSYLTNRAREHLPSEHKPEPSPAAEEEEEEEEEEREDPGSGRRSLSHPAAEASSGERSDGSDARDRSCVSESDLDVAEMETVAYAVNEEERPDANEDGVSLGPTTTAESEDDALRLVREIFFT